MTGGVSTPLECKSSQPVAVVALSIRYTLVGTEHAKSPEYECRSLYQGMQAWLVYGTFQGCTIDIVSPTLASVSCVVTTAQCIAEEYVKWLGQQLASQQANIASWITSSSCILSYSNNNINNINNNNVVLSAPLVMKQSSPYHYFLSPSPNGTGYINNNNNKAPLDSPLLISQSLQWGISPAEALGAMGLAVLVCSGLVVALLLLCALCRTSSFRRRILDKFYAKTKARHASAVHNLKNLKKDIP